MVGPLHGVRIVDMTSVLMGPFATQILADYGADVIKVEGTEGDLMRHGGAMRHPRMGALFLQANRNKRSIVLDAKTPAGREAILRLTATADVFVHNVRTAAMARLRLSFEDVRSAREDIVYASLVGYGEAGRYAGRPAYDDLVQGISGIASLFARGGHGEPRFVPMNMADRVVGLNAVHAIMAALFHRERTGEGQSVEVPMFETMAQFVLGDHLGGLTFVPAAGPSGYNRLLAADRRPYRTADGYLAVLVYTDRQWRNFLAAAGRPGDYANPLYSDHATRTRNYDKVYANIAALMLEDTTQNWLDKLSAHDVPCVEIHTVESLIEDGHLSDVNLIQELEHPSEGRIRVVGPPGSFSRTQPVVRTPAPGLGQHTRELLGEVGFGTTEIDAMLASGSAVEADGASR